jgi:hypothetical protein
MLQSAGSLFDFEVPRWGGVGGGDLKEFVPLENADQNSKVMHN